MTAVEIAKGNDAGLSPSINLVGLFVGNGCTGNKTPSCGEAEGTTPLLHTSSVSPATAGPSHLTARMPDADRCCRQGQRLRVLWGHAMLSDALFEEIVGSCPTELSVLPDCMQLTTVPECGVVPPSYNSDRLRLSSMRPGDCTRTVVSYVPLRLL